MILALPSAAADARMRVFNADGGEAQMCGNGIRCLGKYLWDEGLVRRNPMTIETLAGVLTLTLGREDGPARLATVDMGIPRMRPADIPVNAPTNVVSLELDGVPTRFFCVSMS